MGTTYDLRSAAGLKYNPAMRVVRLVLKYPMLWVHLR
jgi:hypothetical protein